MSALRETAAPAGRRGAPEGTEAAPPAILVDRVVKDYPDGQVRHRALRDVSLTVEEGAYTTIMGPSGSGKSTLLHLLGALDSPTSGEILVDGRALSAMTDHDRTLLRRRRVGFVFQSFNLVPTLSVADNVALPAVIDGRRRADYREWLEELVELVGLGALADRLPGRLSGGEQQRVAVARALFPRQAVVLADEPTGNLDTATGAQVLSVLRAVQRRLGQTVVAVTHDPRAAAVGDDVVALRDGAIVGRLDLAPWKEAEREAAVLAWLREPGP